MTDEIRDKLAKIYELVNRGATEGEREAAKKALDRMLKKFNLDPSVLDRLDLKAYRFKYVTLIELKLLVQIMRVMVKGAVDASQRAPWMKMITSQLRYIDWITIECAYEYFRRHMKKEWKRIVAPELAHCRKTKTRNKRRMELDEIFIQRYLIASKLYKADDLVTYKPKSEKEARDVMKLRDVEGGEYNRQLIGDMLLEGHVNQLEA